jgi:capsular exopolysaccharide synthesis family protein
LIDGDMRRPQVAQLLGLEARVGLTTVLVGSADHTDVVQHHAPSGLAVLAAGPIPPNPAELLQSKAMRDLLAKLRNDYDVIVIDSPPLLPVTDAALLAAETDGAVLVVRHGKTTKDQVANAVDRLESVESTPLGIVFNMIPTRRGAKYGYGYGYGYAPTEGSHAAKPAKQHPVG